MTKKGDKISIIDYLTDSQLLGLTVSEAQETLLRAGFGLPPGSKSQRDIYRLCTGRESWPQDDFPEITIIAGARAGKDSRTSAQSSAMKPHWVTTKNTSLKASEPSFLWWLKTNAEPGSPLDI